MFADETSIMLASPGAIRREYEIQMRKEDAELEQQRVAEAKASEAFIRKLTEEEEYQQTVREESIRFDQKIAEEIAKKLSNEPGPSSTSGIKVNKKQQSLDKFLKSKSDLASSNTAVKSAFLPIVNYATKNFTTRILCQERKAPETTNSFDMLKKAPYKKSHLRIQRIAAEAEISDSSDSIESECRYFKPIDHKNIPPSKALPPIKIPTKVGNAVTVIIG